MALLSHTLGFDKQPMTVTCMTDYIQAHCGVVLGQGRYGVVYQHGSEYAFKVVSRYQRIHNSEVRNNQNEDREMLAQWFVKHPTLMQLLTVLQDDTQRGYLFPLAKAGDLMTLLMFTGSLQHDRFITLSLRIASGLLKLHSSSIAHRDVKPDNILLMAAEAPIATAVLADFGSATFGAAPRSGCTELTGTFAYWAPELFAVRAPRRESYGYQVDCWSLGVSLYSACCGMPPFDDASSQYEEPSYVLDITDSTWQSLRAPVRNTLSALLAVDDAIRCSCKNVIEHLGDVAQYSTSLSAHSVCGSTS